MSPWTSVSRRDFLASSTAAVLGTSLGPLSAWADAKKPPRAFSDYRVTLDGKELPTHEVMLEVPVKA